MTVLLYIFAAIGAAFTLSMALAVAWIIASECVRRMR